MSRVRATKLRRHAPRPGGQFEAENDADEAAGAGGDPSLRRCWSVERDRYWKHCQEHARDNHQDHGDRGTEGKLLWLRLQLIGRRPVLQVALGAYSLDGNASQDPSTDPCGWALSSARCHVK